MSQIMHQQQSGGNANKEGRQEERKEGRKKEERKEKEKKIDHIEILLIIKPRKCCSLGRDFL